MFVCLVGVLGLAVDATGDHSHGVVGDLAVVTELSFVDQVVRGGDLVVAVCFDAFYCVVVVEGVVIEHYFVDCIINRHFVFSWEQAWLFLLLDKFEPGMIPNLIQSKSFFWISVQYPFEDICAVLTHEFRNLIVS